MATRMIIGTVLSGSTTSESAFQPLEGYEKQVIEGKLVIVHSTRNNVDILGRISSIVPHNAFYTEGDAFSEARRKGLPIPGNIAKQYQVCKIDLLQNITGGTISVSFPPHPGDPVYFYDPSTDEENLFGMKRGSGDEKHIWYGTQIGYSDAPIALAVENMPMHMASFGVTGSGKSYNMGSIMEALSDIPFRRKEGLHVPYPMLIIDANGDYSDYARFNESEELGSFGIQSIQRLFFPESYQRERILEQSSPSLKKLSINLDALDARDLSEMIIEFYQGSSVNLSELQISTLQRHVDAAVDDMGFTKQALFTSQISWLRNEIENDSIAHSSTKAAIIRAVDGFYRRMEQDNKLFSDTQCDWFHIKDRIEELTRGQIAILDFSADGATGIDLPIKQFVIGYLSAVLFRTFTKYKQQGRARYLCFVIEEAQNFCPGRRYPIGSSLAKTKLSAIATQGRKFGLSLCLISQRPSFVDEIVLSMCNTFFIHRVSPDDVSFVRSITGGLPESLARRLTNLSQGECIVTGQMNKLPFAVLIKGPEDRKVEHTAGRTDVVQTIADVRGLS